MATKLQSVKFESFDEGLDDTTPSTKLPVNRAQTARNWNFVPGGGLEKRKGSTKINSSAIASGAAITGLSEFRNSDGSKFLMAAAGSSIFKMDDLDGTFDDITGAVVSTSNQDNLFTSAIMNNIHIFSNGVDVPIAFTGTGNATALAGSPPSGRSVIHINNFIFFGRLPANKSRVQFSNLADPEIYTGTDFIDVKPDDGDEIEALGSLFNNLYVFKGFSIHRIPVINPPFPRETIATGIGAAGAKAITNVGGTHLFFMTKDGRFMTFDGSILTDVSSARIQNKISTINKSRLQFVNMTTYQKRRQVWIVYSTGSNTTHNEILIYDFEKGINNGSWMVYTGIAANAVLAMRDQRSASSEDELILTGDYSGFTRFQDVGVLNDDTGNIDAFWETGWNFLGSEHNIKLIRFGHILATKEGTTVTMDFQVGFDFETSFSLTERVTLAESGSEWGIALWGVDVWSGKEIIQIPLVGLSNFGLAIKFGLRSNSTDELSLLRGFEIRAKELGTRTSDALT